MPRKIHGHARGGKQTRLYKAWGAMKARCNNPVNWGYKWYGARGIRVCERWGEFKNFLADMGERPEGYWIERIDNDGDYEPGNCRWVTPKENVANSRKREPRVSVEHRREVRRLHEERYRQRHKGEVNERERKRREKRRGYPVAAEVAERMRAVALKRWKRGVEVELIL